eukprot:jgi/Galph1/14/GphlegSOOS_G71.1
MPNNVKEEWITVPPHCQVVVCSTETLKEFLGGQNEGWLEQLEPLSNLLPNSFLHLLQRLPDSVSVPEQQSFRQQSTSGTKLLSDTNAMQTVNWTLTQ